MSIIKPKTLAGFQDLLPHEAWQQRKLIDKLVEVFESFGFSTIQTPHLEYTECLIGETGGEIGKQLFRFQDNGDRDVCLRFDLTVPLARYVVQHKNELTFPFKRYAAGSCFRGERPQQGRFREFMQCDFDILGVDSAFSDAEIIQVLAASYQALGIDNFIIKVNNRKILNSFAKQVNLENKAVEFIRLLDKKDKITAEKFNQELSELGCKDCQAVADFLAISNLKELKSENKKELADLFDVLSKLPDVLKHIQLDLSLARGFGYYTGNVFEVALPEVPEVGSVGSGGRYNNLTQNFSKDLIPGVGGSVGISRVLIALQKLKQLEAKTSPATILISNLEDSLQAEVNQIASELRATGLNAEVYPEITKLKKQIQYADKKNIKYFLIFGAEEAEKGTFQLKNLQSGEQQEISEVQRVMDYVG